MKVGLIRPVTLWPFPEKVFQEAAKHASQFLAVEISMGQMVEDIRLAVNGRAPVRFYGRIGMIPNPEEITSQIIEAAQGRDGNENSSPKTREFDRCSFSLLPDVPTVLFIAW